jgi:cellulose synthase/poly-beta-1,6-N-acetylglucosamine synthase-like glycosyltransferase
MDPLVRISVVIPCRNDGALLAECLAALGKQTVPPDEIIVVDGYSTDDTAAVAAAAGVRVVYPALPGIFPATAAGFDAVPSGIIARLDADSIPPRDWIDRVRRHFESAPLATAVTGPGVFYGGNRLIQWVAARVYIGGYFTFVGLLLGHPPLFGSNFAIRREAWERVRDRVNSDRDDIHDDLDLSYHLEPDMLVLYDRDLRVAVSARPLSSWGALGRRLAMAYRTFALDFGEEPPLARLRRRRRWRRQSDARGPAGPIR